jgi:hypothetical protein
VRSLRQLVPSILKEWSPRAETETAVGKLSLLCEGVLCLGEVEYLAQDFANTHTH